MRSLLRGVALSLIVCTPVLAQEAPVLRPHHVTLLGGIAWAAPYDVGDATAQLRGNAPGATAPPFTLFSADSRLSMAFAPEFRVGFPLTRSFAIDGGLSFSRPRVAIAIANDAEAPPQQLDGEQLDQYQIDAQLTWQVPVPARARSRATFLHLAPFVAAGGGYLRQLHEGRALAETGWIYHAGGGARYWLRGGSGSSRDLGVQADARFNVRTGGIDFDNARRYYPSVSVMLFVGL